MSLFIYLKQKQKAIDKIYTKMGKQTYFQSQHIWNSQYLSDKCNIDKLPLKKRPNYESLSRRKKNIYIEIEM